jgi:hypothetical protein
MVLRAHSAKTAAALPSGQRAAELAVAAMMGSTFGPYLSAGIRTEQATVYGLAAVGAVGLLWMRARLNRYGVAVMALLILMAVLATIGVVAPVGALPPYPLGELIAGYDNLLLPVAAVAATTMFTSGSLDRIRIVRVAVAILVAGMCLNALVAFWSIGHNPEGLFAGFWTGDPTLHSVAERAGQMGRYSGVFNQPAEAGTAYSIALIGAIWLLARKPVYLVPAITLLTVGGVLTVSKVFLFAGVPVGAWSLLRATTRRPATLGVTLLAAGAAYVADRVGYLPAWTGSRYLDRLFVASNGDLVDLYTAGRFGSNSTLAATVGPILNRSPWFGFGAGGLAVPYDNGWVEALVVCGLIGAAIYTFMLACLAGAWLKHRASPYSTLTGGLVAVAVAASFGVPALTANRVSTAFWVLATLLLLTGDRDDGYANCRNW